MSNYLAAYLLQLWVSPLLLLLLNYMSMSLRAIDKVDVVVKVEG
jgi:hypothetical protein